MYADLTPEEPSDVEIRDCGPSDHEPSAHDPDSDELDEPCDLDFTDMPFTDEAGRGSDESQWEAFLPDDDWDPEPDPGDFWIEGISDDTPAGALLFPLHFSPSLSLHV